MAEALRLRSFGKYDLIVSLGRGGMADVYLALAAGLGRFNKLLVLKILRDDALPDRDEAIGMFLDEARLSARLVHPNIVQTYEVGEHEGRYFIAMEYLDGQSYRTLQQRGRGTAVLPLHEELRILSETARGLHYAHQLRGYDGEPLHVVHRDVSPQNVFVTYDGQVKLLDFGIAKTADAEHMTQVGLIKGKLEYIAPEQVQGEAIDCRADVFSLGAMLWEAVTGRRFAGGPKVAEVAKLHARIMGGEPNVRSVRPDVPEALAVIIDRALALRPEARWPDAASFADAIDHYLERTEPKPSAASLARAISPVFAGDRLKTAKLIEQQIAKVKERGVGFGENTGTLPRLRLSDDSTSGFYLGGVPPRAIGSIPPAAAASPPAALGDPQTHGVSQNSARAAPRKRRGVLWAFTVGGGVVLAISASLLAGDMMRTLPPSPAPSAERRDKDPDPAPSAPEEPQVPAKQNEPEVTSLADGTAQEPATPPAAAADTYATVTLALEVSPEDAQASLDGAPLRTPFSGKFPKDAALHHLEVRAEGYRTKRQLVAFDQDHELKVVLSRAPKRGGAASQRAQAEERARPTSASEPVEQHSEPASASPPPVVEPGADLTKILKPSDAPMRIDAVDPYSGRN